MRRLAARQAAGRSPRRAVLIQGRVAARFRRGEKSSVEVLSLMAGGEQIDDVTGEFAHPGQNGATARTAR